MSRNYGAEFIAGLLATVPQGEFVPAVVASKYVSYLAETDADLLDGWLHEHAAQFATDVLSVRLRSDRTRSRLHAAAREFAARAADSDFIGSFAITYRIADDDTRVRAGDMTGEQHNFVAREYAASAKTDRMLAAFHRAVAKKVGQRRTADVITEAEYDALYRSIVRAPAVGAA